MSVVSVKQKAALWVGVVFVLGVILGGVLGYSFSGRTHGDMRSPLSDSARRAQKVEQLTKELGLTPDQQKKLDEVLTEVQAKFKAIHEADQPEIEAARKVARDEIRALLTPEQLPKFEEHLRKLDAERKKNAAH
jgi:Spy/CpxP family protein refolding chaperone